MDEGRFKSIVSDALLNVIISVGEENIAIPPHKIEGKIKASTNNLFALNKGSVTGDADWLDFEKRWNEVAELWDRDVGAVATIMLKHYSMAICLPESLDQNPNELSDLLKKREYTVTKDDLIDAVLNGNPNLCTQSAKTTMPKVLQGLRLATMYFNLQGQEPISAVMKCSQMTSCSLETTAMRAIAAKVAGRFNTQSQYHDDGTSSIIRGDGALGIGSFYTNKMWRKKSVAEAMVTDAFRDEFNSGADGRAHAVEGMQLLVKAGILPRLPEYAIDDVPELDIPAA